jgi:hypothetical protein
VSVDKKVFSSYFKIESQAQNQYYSKAYDRIIIENASFCWNWSAAFGGFMWFAYRRMYALALVFLFVPAFIFELFHYLFNFSSIGLGALMFFQALSFIIPGFTGTKLYFNWIAKQIQQQNRYSTSNIDLTTLFIILSLTFAQVAGLTSLGFILIGLMLITEALLQR